MLSTLHTATVPETASRPAPDKRDELLRYLAHLASAVTNGEVDPASVNWRYIRDQVMGALTSP